MYMYTYYMPCILHAWSRSYKDYMVTDKQTHTHTHTQTDYYNPPPTRLG